MLNLVTKWKKEAGMKMMETADKAVFGRSEGGFLIPVREQIISALFFVTKKVKLLVKVSQTLAIVQHLWYYTIKGR